jgi:hypothetical protein
MARDAISRQYDVQKNSMTLICDGLKRSYQPGLITFHAKKGKSIDLEKMRESITASRLSGGTNMRVDYLEITATGNVVFGDKDAVLTVAGTGQQFVLSEDPSAKGSLQKLRDSLARAEKVASVTGRVQGWNGVFPSVLKALAKTGDQSRMQLFLTGFEISKK